MSFQPIVATGGLLGWRFLNKTLERQQEAFAQTPVNQRETEYVRNTIAQLDTPEKLVNDRRVLRVALTAYGLQDDINSKAFIQKILEGGTDDSSSLANRLADDRYAKFSEDFSYGNIGGAKTGLTIFADRLISKYEASEFEIAVGNKDENMRLALNAKRELPEIISRNSSEDTKWFLILGTPPLRTVFEKALALPSSFGSIDIEQQLETLKDLSSRRLNISEFGDLEDPVVLDNLVEQFLLQSQISDFSISTSSASTALTLLRGG